MGTQNFFLFSNDFLYLKDFLAIAFLASYFINFFSDKFIFPILNSSNYPVQIVETEPN